MARDNQTGFVLVAPTGAILAESFRPTREAAKGWLAMVKVGKAYKEWRWHYRNGWRCKPAKIQLIQEDQPQEAAR